MTTDYPIIDALSYIPTEEVVVDLVASLPPQMARYLKDVFGPRVAPLIGMTAEELYRLKTTKTQSEVKEIIATKLKALSMSPDQFIASMDEMGVKKAVIFNLDEESASGLRGLPNDYYADIVRKYPTKFIGIAGIDPLKGMDAYREIRRCYDLGLRGIAVRPFMFRIAPHHPKMYPLYAACVEMQIPIWFHLSINYSTNSMEVERPVYIDVVAQDFPELTIIAGHGGWPWVNEMVAVAWRNSNVYIDFASNLPKYVGMPGTGWEPLLCYGNSILQDRVLFGSTWLFMGSTIKQLADSVRELPLKEEVKHKWLYENARRLFNIS
jgi:hypothetical protein